MKHTKGPWVCHSGMVWKDGPDVYPKGENNGIPIARMDRELGNGTVEVERDCNARLIAQAPEMLKALEELVAEFNTKSLEFSLDHPGTLGLPESGGIIWAKEIIKGLQGGREEN